MLFPEQRAQTLVEVEAGPWTTGQRTRVAVGNDDAFALLIFFGFAMVACMILVLNKNLACYKKETTES